MTNCKTSFKTLVLSAAMLGGTISSANAQMDKMGDMSMGDMKKMATPELKAALTDNFDRLFMIHAAMGNMAEVALADLAMKRTKNPDVLMVAKMTMKGHSAAQKDLAKIFRAKGYPMPPDAGVSNKATYKVLSTMNGATFDKMYLAALVGGHEQTITLFQHEVMSGKEPMAKMHAMNKLPEIIGHASVIYTVAGKVKAPGTNLRPPAVKKAAMDAAMMGKM